MMFLLMEFLLWIVTVREIHSEHKNMTDLKMRSRTPEDDL